MFNEVGVMGFLSIKNVWLPEEIVGSNGINKRKIDQDVERSSTNSANNGWKTIKITIIILQAYRKVYDWYN